MEDYKVKVKMIPICECGYIFWDGIIVYQNIIEEYGMKHAMYSLEPVICPKCKRKIECIEVDNNMIQYRVL